MILLKMIPKCKFWSCSLIILIVFGSGQAFSDETDILDFIPAITAAGRKLPIAVPQSVSTPQGDEIEITLTGDGPFQDAMIFEIISEPQNGFLNGTTPDLTYSPLPEFTGKDSFSFKAANRNGTSEPAEINIYVVHPDNYLQNLSMDFGPYDSQTGKAGAFVFRFNYDKVFLEFGRNVISDHLGNLKDNPAFEYLVDIDADIVSPVNAVVFNLIHQEDTDDYEIHLVPVDVNGVWLNIDHIKYPTVGINEQVTVGQVLGKPGTWDDEVGRVELQLILSSEGESVCPFLYFNPDTKALYESMVTQLINDWETFQSDSELYQEENFVFPGCSDFTTGM